jgi:xanthine/CO dehydrogenase XdhC/CoxF family maturation factor
VNREVIAAAARLRAAGTPHLVATVVRVHGSSYRKPGARLVATEAGRVAGSISGGCLEGALLRTGWWKTRTGPVVVEFDSSDPDDPESVLGCGGVVDVLLERGGGATDALAFAEDCAARRVRGAIATVFEGEGLGTRWCVPGDAPPAIAEACARAIASGAPEIVQDAGRSIFVEPVLPPLELYVFGTGLDVVPVVEGAAKLGFRAFVCPGLARFEHAARFPLVEGDVRERIDSADRAAVIVMSHDVRRDTEAAGVALASRAAYIGILGPRHRTERIAIEHPAVLTDPRVRTPIGLPIGAEGPDEIALAILAEIVAFARGSEPATLARR